MPTTFFEYLEIINHVVYDEATPTGVGIRTAGHPQHWGGLRPSGTGADVRLHSLPLTGPLRGNTGEGSHLPTR